MELTRLDEQPEAEPIVDTTQPALDEAEAEIKRGEAMTLEQSDINLRKPIQARRTAQEAILTA